MSNRAVIDMLANWTEDIGFSMERQAVSPAKYNLIATVGSGSDELVLSGHADTVPRDDKL
jgi:acetylornithine deacetylase